MFKLKQLRRGFPAPARRAGLPALIAIAASLISPLPSAQGAISLEYPIDSIVDNNSLPLAPSINTLGAGSLSVGNRTGSNNTVSTGKITLLPQVLVVGDPLNWQAEYESFVPNARPGSFFGFLDLPMNTSGSLSIDYSNSTLNLGVTPQFFADHYHLTLFLENGNGINKIHDIKINDTFLKVPKNISFDLSNIPAQTGPHNFILTPWVFAGDPPAFLDIDSTGTLENLTIQNAVATASPVPEPHEYALMAGFGLVGFAAYRRRMNSRQESAFPAENNI